MERNPHKILIVDDSRIEQTLLKSVLSKSGFTLFFAETVSEALKLLGSENIGLVLVDFFLAGINDGTALVSKIRKYKVDVKIYAISGSEDTAKSLLAAGCDGILSKDPVEIKRFLEEFFSEAKKNS
jgi:CheY-like chemotaxis protein